MLLSEMLEKNFKYLANPSLKRKTSRKHWKNERNMTTADKAAQIILPKKETTIVKAPIRFLDKMPILDISDDDVHVSVSEEFIDIKIDVSLDELLHHNIDISEDGTPEEERKIVSGAMLIIEWAIKSNHIKYPQKP